MEKLNLDLDSPQAGDRLSLAIHKISQLKNEFLIPPELDIKKFRLEFDHIVTLVRQFGILIQGIALSPLANLARQFETLIRLEAIRCKLSLRAPDQTTQLVPFFFALSSRLESMLLSLKNDPGRLAELDANQTISEAKKRILIVDDSKTFQAILSRICNLSKFLEVVGVASNATEAEQLIYKVHPDLVTLDVHMPGMDGFTFLNHILKKYPIPIVLVSSANEGGFGDIFDALYQGALDFIPKSSVEAKAVAIENVQKRIISAANCTLTGLMKFYTGAPPVLEPGKLDRSKVIVLCAGLGCTRTILDILRQLPNEIPAILISQQINPEFSKILVEKLQSVYPFTLKEAVDGDFLTPSKVLIIPYGKNATIHSDGHKAFVKISDTSEAVMGNQLLDSAAFSIGGKSVAVILPSPNMDLAGGLLEVKLAGGYVIVQEEDECLNPALAREIIRTDSASISCFGDRIGEILLSAVTEGGSISRSKHTVDVTVFEGQGPKILIVDDSPTIRSIVAFNLRGLGLTNLCEAKNGKLAWDMLVEGIETKVPCELVLCDQEMPEVSGNLLLLKVREDPRLKTIPFVMVTGVTDRESVLTAIRSGASDYITKPIQLNSLATKVFALLRKRQSNG